jgi:hypothetical protein
MKALGDQSASRLTTTASATSSQTHVQPNERQPSNLQQVTLPSHRESVVPEEKIEKAEESLEIDWENDPDNPRNWPFGKKWRAVAIVSLFHRS